MILTAEVALGSPDGLLLREEVSADGKSWPWGVPLTAQPDAYRVMNETRAEADCRARRFTELFGTYYRHVLGYARRRVGADLAQDVVAETFCAAWRNLDVLPPEPLPWLYRTAHFVVANQRRALARRGRLDDRARLLLASDEIARDHSELVAADMELAAAFRSLSEADREVLRLAAWEGLSAVAIGTVVGCSAAAAKARLHRARRRLSRKLGADLQDPHQHFPVHPAAFEEE
jgi:RNA polymerase sigma-70 factor, ECF subfamily